MYFRKPWLRVKSVNFDFSAKSSSIDYNKYNKPTPKCLAQIRSEKSLVELGVPKNELFHIFRYTEKFNFYPEAWLVLNHQVLTNYNEPNKLNPKSLAHIGSEKSLVELGLPKNKLFNFF